MNAIQLLQYLKKSNFNIVVHIRGSLMVSKNISWMSKEHLTVLWTTAEEYAFLCNTICCQLEKGEVQFTGINYTTSKIAKMMGSADSVSCIISFLIE